MRNIEQSPTITPFKKIFITISTILIVTTPISWAATTKPRSPPKTIQITSINLSNDQLDAFKLATEKYSKGSITIASQNKTYPFRLRDSLPQDEAYRIADMFKPETKFLFINFPGTPNANILATYHDPQLNIMITTGPDGIYGRELAYEFSLQLISWYNANNGRNRDIPINDVMHNPPEALIIKNFSSISPHLQKLGGSK
jgi:hypothetical protein